MRKITKQAIEAFMAGHEFKSANTEVVVNTHGSYLRLHNNLIAVSNNNTCQTNPNKILVSLAGWNTKTTRERLNGIPGVSIHTVKGVPILNGKVIEEDKFYTV